MQEKELKIQNSKFYRTLGTLLEQKKGKSACKVLIFRRVECGARTHETQSENVKNITC
jgi:hypothetical protein